MSQVQDSPTSAAKPEYVHALEAAFGAPSQAAFGSAVFFVPDQAADELEQTALHTYQYFVGNAWARFGEATWMGPWQAVYHRPADAKGDIITELRGIMDRKAKLAVTTFLDANSEGEKALTALKEAVDAPAVSELAVYNIGDSAEMSGILISAYRAVTGEAVYVMFLLD